LFRPFFDIVPQIAWVAELVASNAAFCYSLAMKESEKKLASVLAKAITAICVRNTFLEDLHAGTSPSSKTGDFSDVKVVTPHGEIPWRNLSRISDEEMKRLMKQVVNNVYTFLCRQEDPVFTEAFVALGSRYAARWDEPEAQTDFVAADKPSRKLEPGGSNVV
jgi:hypothetical protein